MLERENACLVIVDVQGKLAELVYAKEELYKNLKILVSGARVLGLPVLYMEQYPKGLGHTIPELTTLLAEQKPIIKNTFSACGSLDFDRALSEIGKSQVILCGIETHVCVYQTCRDLLQQGFEVHLVIDAVSSRTEKNMKLGIACCRTLGAILTGTEMLLFELLEKSGTPEFKEISRLVK
ncbi:hydrolase [Candidatus Riflebacteria bacterium]